VFVAGDCAGTTIVIEAMAYGRKAAISAHRFLTGQDLKKARDFANEYYFTSKLDIPLTSDVQDLPRLPVQMLDPDERKKSFIEAGTGLSDEDALAESGRCLECECKNCIAECIMLNEFTAFPGELFQEFLRTGDMKPLLVYSCNMCDQCTLVCPKDFKFAELFGAFRREMVQQSGGNSPMPGHKAINMHQKLGFSKLFSVKIKGGGR
jgi:ferredoxin